MNGSSRDPDSRRSALVVVLLLASLLLMGVLGWEAWSATRTQRATIESVLRDYASLAAGEFVRRSTAEIGYYGHYTLLNTLAGSDELPTPLALGESPDEALARAASLARSFFRLGLDSGDLEIAGEQPDAGVREWLVGAVRRKAAGMGAAESPFAVVQGVVDGRQHAAAFAAPADVDGLPSVVGFEVAIDALEPWFTGVFERRPLLPSSLGDGDLDNGVLFLSVVDQAGVERFRGGGRYASHLFAEVPFGDAYGGIFEGMTVRASIDPASASQLVIGGLPYSRLPLLLLLLLLTSGFVVAAILQLRRERALAALRSEFVSRVSHELRTPLTQIRMFAETLLLGRVRSEEEGKRSLEIIDQEAQRLGHLVENILQLSRSERGTVKLTPTLQPVAPILRAVLESFRPLADRKGVRVQASLADGPMAAVDDDAVRQIFLNLLDNAVKYGPSGQEVRVGLSADDDGLRIVVDDEGPGIPVRERDVIWKRFRRLERDGKAAIAGTGIGLAVVRDLVVRQGGTILVDESDRGGARFVVTFPSPAGAPAAQGRQPATALPAAPAKATGGKG